VKKLGCLLDDVETPVLKLKYPPPPPKQAPPPPPPLPPRQLTPPPVAPLKGRCLLDNETPVIVPKKKSVQKRPPKEIPPAKIDTSLFVKTRIDRKFEPIVCNKCLLDE
jgi:hypothetical protein